MTTWFANYSEWNFNRSVETKAYNTLREATEKLKGNNGYIIRQDENGNKLVKMSEGFEPSSIEQKKIDNIIAA